MQLLQPFDQEKLSIKTMLQMSYLFIAILMIIPAIYSISLFSRHTKRYDHIITNVSRANRLNQIVKFDITNEIWEIVAGKKTFEEGRQYQILILIKSGISTMMESTETEKNIQLLEVANRAVNTLEKYVDMLGEQMAENASVSENEVILEEVRGVASLLYDILQDFIVSEIEVCAITNERIKQTSLTFTRIQLLILLVILGVSVFTSIKVSLSIRKPIQDMETFSFSIASGQLNARIEQTHVPELEHLSENLNVMAGKYKGL